MNPEDSQPVNRGSSEYVDIVQMTDAAAALPRPEQAAGAEPVLSGSMGDSAGVSTPVAPQFVLQQLMEAARVLQLNAAAQASSQSVPVRPPLQVPQQQIPPVEVRTVPIHSDGAGISIGDYVIREGRPCLVISVHRSVDPPHYTVRTTDEQELDTQEPNIYKPHSRQAAG